MNGPESGNMCRWNRVTRERQMTAQERLDPSDDDLSGRVAQAQGMVSAQADCTVDEALRLMRAHARSSDLSLAYVATAILSGTLRFDAE